MPMYVARIEQLYEIEAAHGSPPSDAGQKWMHIQWYYRSAELPAGVREAHHVHPRELLWSMHLDWQVRLGHSTNWILDSLLHT